MNDDGLDGLRVRTGNWNELGAQCSALRREVFVEEQHVPAEIEIDGRDPDCVHALATLAGQPVGTGRLLPDGRIGRLAVRAAFRGKGIGAALLALLIEEARERGFASAVLNAQTGALGFYEGFGFSPVGEEFVEAGIRHQRMELRLD